jgi:HKD family nuclease
MKLLSNTTELQYEFQRLSKKFENIEIVTAWIGNPAKEIPFKYLETFIKVDVYAGISFCQTHPDGIKYILKLPKRKRTLVLIEEPFTFHMKVYHFYNANESALIMGSSNFTLSGFTDNAESNIVLEGKEKQGLISNYLSEIKSKISTYNQIKKIEGKWLEDYTRRFYARRKKLNDIKASDDSIREDIIQNGLVWLRNGTWEDYMDELKKPIAQSGENLAEFVNNHSNLLTLYNNALRFPWAPKMFEDENKRAMLWGTKSKIKKRDYGWLGYVGVSGGFKSLLLNGSSKSKSSICNSINSIAKQAFPIDAIELTKQLKRLEETGPTIKVWGRALAITQPELFYTISSDDVRRTLAKLLAKPISFFSTIEGYVYVLNIIHNSPWFNSPEPKDKIEKLVWQNRCAFLDVIFRN